MSCPRLGDEWSAAWAVGGRRVGDEWSTLDRVGVVRLPYDEAGDGEAIVLLHAGVADRTMWREHLEPLAGAGYRPVAPDLPGFGEAPMPAGPLAPWHDVLDTLDALGIARASLVGNSLGGMVALRMALLAPARVEAVALISVPPPDLEEPSSELKAAWARETEALERGDVEAAIDAVVDEWTRPDAPNELRDRVAQMQRRAFATQLAAGEIPEAPDPLKADPGRLADIAVPALVAAGEHDLIDFRDGARRMAGLLPNARHCEITGAMHLAPLETPQAFRELLLRFLADRR
jgi:pimeloyl-ACP methyl ester carboxylesterase